jgi:hypothetical protein
MAISSDSHWLVTGCDYRDTTARLWDLTAPDPTATPIVLRGHDEPISAVAISPDNHWLVTGSEDTTARLWDLSALLKTGLTASDPAASPIVLRGHEDPVWAMAFSSDSRWLVTGCEDDTARLWDLTAPDPAAEPIVLRGHKIRIYAVAFSPDNHWLVTGSWDDTARLWDLTAPDPAAESIVLRGHDEPISAMAISPDNHWLVTGSWDYTARLWDLTALDQAAEPIVLRGHNGSIYAVAFSPDNHWLVTGSDDGTARLWNLRLDELVGLACRTAGRNLIYKEWKQYFPGQEYRQTCSNLPVPKSVISGIVDQAKSFAQAGDLEAASSGYTQVVQWAIETDEAELNNHICWVGSIDGFAEIVLPVCEHAVELAPGHGMIRDSRGLARALTKDYLGAIEDFKFFVEWSKEIGAYEEYGTKREAWIAELEAGRNPFDSATLEALRSE